VLKVADASKEVDTFCYKINFINLGQQLDIYGHRYLINEKN